MSLPCLVMDVPANLNFPLFYCFPQTVLGREFEVSVMAELKLGEVPYHRP